MKKVDELLDNRVTGFARAALGTSQILDRELENTGAFEIKQILKERAEKYGDFESLAAISQKLKSVMHNASIARGSSISFDKREALEMIVHKIARILNGDPDYADSWRDIAGYAALVADKLDKV